MRLWCLESNRRVLNVSIWLKQEIAQDRMKIHPIHFCLWTEDHGNHYDLYITQVQHYKNARRQHSLSTALLSNFDNKMQAQSCYIRSRMIQQLSQKQTYSYHSQILPEHAPFPSKNHPHAYNSVSDINLSCLEYATGTVHPEHRYDNVTFLPLVLHLGLRIDLIQRMGAN